MSTQPATASVLQDDTSEWPPFDPSSYVRVGGHLLAAACAQPELGLRLGRAPGTGADNPPHWYVGTQVATARDAQDSNISFTTHTPFLGDLARRMDEGDFSVWVDGIAEGFAAGLVHRVRRAQTAAQLSRARLALETSLATADQRPAPELGAAEPHAEVSAHHFNELEDNVPVLRRSRR